MTCWNYFQDGRRLFLCNESKTILKKHKGIDLRKIDFIFESLNYSKFPILFTEGLKSIHFTYLKHGLQGDYDWEGNIRIGLNKVYDPSRTLIHEIGHFLDQRHNIMNQDNLIKEWEDHAYIFNHPDINREPCEFFAMTFENFYMPENKNINNFFMDVIPRTYFEVTDVFEKQYKSLERMRNRIKTKEDLEK